MLRSELMLLVSLRMDRGQRYGQAVFNVLYEHFPVEVERFRGSLVDPFYEDGNVEPFLERLGI